MKLQRIALWLIILLGGCVGIASAQQAHILTLSEANLQDAAGNPFAGQVQLCPTLNSGIPTAFNNAGLSMRLNSCTTITVTGGAFTVSLPDGNFTSPKDVCFAIHAWDPVTNADDLNLPCVQPSSDDTAPGGAGYGWCTTNDSGTVCSLDSYLPNNPAIPVETVTGGTNGSVTTAAVDGVGQITNNTTGNAGGLSAPAWASGTTYAAGTVVSSGGGYYLSIISSNTGNTPSSSPSDWYSFGGGNVTASAVNGLSGLTISTTGNAGTATNLDHTPNQCSAGSVPTGITAHGDATGCAPAGSGITNLNGHTGSNITLVASDVGAAQAPDAGSRFALLANNLIATNQFAFAPSGTPDGTHCWYAGSTYTSEGCYGEDTIQTMLAYPGRFTSADILSIVNKFIAAKKVSGDGNPSTLTAGDFPQSLLPSGAAGQFCSGLDQYCHLATGGGKIFTPLGLWLYWQKTGDLTQYTADVTAIKTALALVPTNGSTHCVYITAGQEDIPGNGYMEYMRPTGNVANASTWYAWDYLALKLMATAAGDSTNATFFGTQFTNLTGCLQNTLTDSTSNLLWFADGQSKQLDIADSTLAIYPLLGSANGTLLSGTQATAISNWLNTNYASLVNAAGYVKLINACNSGQVGAIPSGGGPTYISYAGNNLTGYQCGYWATFGGYFAYALSLAHPAQARTYLSTYISGSGGTSPTTEYYNGGSLAPQGDPALMTTAQSMRMASDILPATPASFDGYASTAGFTLLGAAPSGGVGASCTNNGTILAADSSHIYVCVSNVVESAALTGPTFTAPTYVSKCTNTVSSSSTTAVTCTLTPAAGDFAVVDCRGILGTGSYTATSSPSATFAQQAFDIGSGGSNQASIAFGQTGGSTTYTCTASAGTTYQTIEVADYHPNSVTSLVTSATNEITSATGTFNSSTGASGTINTSGPSFIISIADPQFATTSVTVGTIAGTAANGRAVATSDNSIIQDLALPASTSGVTSILTATPTGTWGGTILVFH